MVSNNSEDGYHSDESTGSCEETTNPDMYFKNLDLQYFVEEPLTMLYNFAQLKSECLATGSPTAHYIEGLLQYFHCRKSIKGLSHLRQSADGDYDNGIYLYGILMLCRGEFAEGREYLDKLSWKNNQDRSPQCLAMIKRSLKEIRVALQTRYLTNTAAMEPLADCEEHDVDGACEVCYYYKKMTEFVDFIRAKKQ